MWGVGEWRSKKISVGNISLNIICPKDSAKDLKLSIVNINPLTPHLPTSSQCQVEPQHHVTRANIK
jgi:hypothetical protein